MPGSDGCGLAVGAKPSSPTLWRYTFLVRWERPSEFRGQSAAEVTTTEGYDEAETILLNTVVKDGKTVRELGGKISGTLWTHNLVNGHVKWIDARDATK